MATTRPNEDAVSRSVIVREAPPYVAWGATTHASLSNSTSPDGETCAEARRAAQHW